uniref:MCP four helix bundle domain-containing protein n=1 Tax=Noviherbaspirillum sp. TaxID=1926288 RepID=UPI002FE30F90
MTHLRAVKIGARLGIGFGIILLMVVCVLAADILISANARDAQNQGLRHANAKAVQAGLMRSAVLEGGIAARNVGLQYTTPSMLKEEEKFQQQRAKFLEAQKKLTDLGLGDAEKAIVASIVSLNAQTDAPLKEAMELVKSYSNEAAGKLISSQIDPLNQKAIAEIDKLVNLQQAAIDGLLE